MDSYTNLKRIFVRWINLLTSNNSCLSIFNLLTINYLWCHGQENEKIHHWCASQTDRDDKIGMDNILITLVPHWFLHLFWKINNKYHKLYYVNEWTKIRSLYICCFTLYLCNKTFIIDWHKSQRPRKENPRNSPSALATSWQNNQKLHSICGKMNVHSSGHVHIHNDDNVPGDVVHDSDDHDDVHNLCTVLRNNLHIQVLL